MLDLLGKQNPDLQVDREQIQRLLTAARDMLVAGRMRWELVQPEFQQLSELSVHGKRLSLFDLVGRTRFSLNTTRCLLIILKKSLSGGAMVDDHVTDLTVAVQYIDGILVLVDSAIAKLEAVNSWLGWFKSPSPTAAHA